MQDFLYWFHSSGHRNLKSNAMMIILNSLSTNQHKICMTILKKDQKTVFKNCYGYIVTFLKAPGLMNEFIEAQAGAVLAGAAQAGAQRGGTPRAQRLQLNDLQRSAPSTDTTDSLAEPRFVNYFYFFLVLQFNFFSCFEVYSDIYIFNFYRKFLWFLQNRHN